MKMRHLLALTCVPLVGIFAATALAAPQVKMTVCHKYGTPDEATITIGYPAVAAHLQNHGDWMGACTQFDRYIDTDGIAAVGRGIPTGIDVRVGFNLSGWPAPGNEGIDMFDNDSDCLWTLGDDLQLEDGTGACTTGAIRNAIHDFGLDCIVLDLDASLFNGQQVDFDLEGAIPFSGCSVLDPDLMFYDANGDGSWNDGEDIVLDVNGNGVFD
jgi:hypothetical protein